MKLSGDTSGLSRIFLCHSRGDRQSVRHLYNRLKVDGYKPWLDEEDLLPGQVWEAEINNAILSSAIVLICLSNDSIAKPGFMHKEISHTLDLAKEYPENQIFLIPVRLQECALPEQLSKWHSVDLFVPNGYERLKKALSTKQIVARDIPDRPVRDPQNAAPTN